MGVRPVALAPLDQRVCAVVSPVGIVPLHVHPQADDGGAAPQLEARETTRAEAPKN